MRFFEIYRKIFSLFFVLFCSFSVFAIDLTESAFQLKSADNKYKIVDFGTLPVPRSFRIYNANSEEKVFEGFYMDADELLSADGKSVNFVKIYTDLKNVTDGNLQNFISKTKSKIPSDIKKWIQNGNDYAVAETFVLDLDSLTEKSTGKYEYIKLQ